VKYNFFIILCIIFIFSCTKKQETISANSIALSPNALHAVLYISDSIGIVGGGQEYQSDEIWLTKNGGVNWQKKPTASTTAKWIRCFHQLPNGTIIAGGAVGYVAISTDTGSTWQFVQLANYTDVRSITHINDTLFLACGKGASGFITKLHLDGTFISEQAYKHEMTSIAFATNQIGYTSAMSAIVKTIDGGVTWQYTTAKNDLYTSIATITANNVIACGFDGSILQSIDGGANWLSIKQSNAVHTKFRWNAICIANPTTAYIIGDNGLMAKVNLVDKSYQLLQLNTDANLLGICKKNNSTLVICTSIGNVLEVQL
jgi:photosystem II stability/assembly factor-like uncharacterized protein